MVEERIMVFNIRKAGVKTPKWRRSRDVMSILKSRLGKLSKTGEVKVDGRVNEAMWSRGQKVPKLRMKLKVTKKDDGSIVADLA